MKLLFDQNISYRLLKKIQHFYPEANQVRELGLENATDLKIWGFARENNYAIVTFDADFFDLSNLKGHPPKIIWLRMGNTTTNNLEKVFIEKRDLLEEFLSNTEYKNIACLEVE
jgi:predicted nuclease of predicted toxin-antitoxin system